MVEDMNPKHAKISKKEGRPVNFRATKITASQITDLMLHWGENISQVLTRAVQQAWEREVGSRKDKR